MSPKQMASFAAFITFLAFTVSRLTMNFVISFTYGRNRVRSRIALELHQ